MADYTPNRWILDEIAANRKWMVEMMDGMPTECLTNCAKEIESLRAELVRKTDELDSTIRNLRKVEDERDEARREVLMNEANHLPTMSDPFREAKRRGWDCLESRRPWDCHKDYK